MKNTKVFPVAKLASMALVGVTLAGSMALAAPPTRQTPMIVSKDKKGVVEVGQCQMPPAVGGQVCTPNARDYGYFDGTWRQWPTQQRYDQKFPQAIGSLPISPYASRPVQEPQLATAVQAPQQNQMPQEGGYVLPNMQQTLPTAESPDSEASILQEIVPGMAPASAPSTPTTPIAPPPADPSTELDLSTVELGEPEAAKKAPKVNTESQAPEASTPSSVPETPEAPATSEPLPEPAIPTTAPAAPSEEEMMPTLDSPNVKKANTLPVLSDPLKITPEVPEVKKIEQKNSDDLQDVKETGKNPADPFDFSSNDVPNLSELAEDENVPSFSSEMANVESAPVSESAPANVKSALTNAENAPANVESALASSNELTEEESVPAFSSELASAPAVPAENAGTTPMAEFVPVENANIEEYPEYNAQLAVSDIVPADGVSMPAAWEANEVAVSENSIAQTNYAAPSAPFVDVNSSIPSVADSLAATSEKKIGLDGFCPVSLLSTEEWVKGDARWSVLHHGVTYYLASPEMVQQFLSNPEKYAPVLDGNDPVAHKDTQANVSGMTDFCVVYEGQLYMFSSEENMTKFFNNAEMYR